MARLPATLRIPASVACRKNGELAFASSGLSQEVYINDPGAMVHSRLAELPETRYDRE
jgi:hypothetical protein